MQQNGFVHVKPFPVRERERDTKSALSFFPFGHLRKEIWIL